MSKLRLIPFAVMTVGTMLAGGGAFAQSMYDIDRRQDYQQSRIEQGVRDGQITRSEQHRLEQGERAIDRAQARAMADGHVSPGERQRLDRMVDRESRQIYQQSHDRQQAWDRGQNWGRTDGRPFNGWNDRDGRGQGWNHGDRDGGNHRDADRRDWDRDHNDGSWNQGRDHNGWDRDRSASSGHSQGGWQGNWGGQHNGSPGAGATTTPGTPASHQWGNHGGASGGSVTTTSGTSQTPPSGTTTRSGGNRSWGGNLGGTTTTSASSWSDRQTFTAQAPSGGQSRSFGGGGRQR